MVKCDANWEIMNTYENLQIVWCQFITNKLIFIYIQSNLNIYWFISIQFVANEYKWTAIWLHSTIHNIQSPIQWAITKVILNYLPLPKLYYLAIYHTVSVDCYVHIYISLSIERANIHCQGISLTRIFEVGLATVMSQRLEFFKWAAKSIFKSTIKT